MGYNDIEEEGRDSKTKHIAQLRVSAAVSSVSQQRPRRFTMRVPASLLQFDRDELCHHLKDIANRDGNDITVFEPTSLETIEEGYDELTQKKIVNISNVSTSDTSNGVHLATPKHSSSEGHQGYSNSDSYPKSVRLSGHHGPFQRLMGIYKMCESNDGPVEHNGQPLYRLQRRQINLMTSMHR